MVQRWILCFWWGHRAGLDSHWIRFAVAVYMFKAAVGRFCTWPGRMRFPSLCISKRWNWQFRGEKNAYWTVSLDKCWRVKCNRDKCSLVFSFLCLIYLTEVYKYRSLYLMYSDVFFRYPVMFWDTQSVVQPRLSLLWPLMWSVFTQTYPHNKGAKQYDNKWLTN